MYNILIDDITERHNQRNLMCTQHLFLTCPYEDHPIVYETYAVERAFVHTDYEYEHQPQDEHKIYIRIFNSGDYMWFYHSSVGSENALVSILNVA
ncbi:hypothetical protein DICVIV_09563 [Dictyocaulus viviparus]|uniref:Uncharacterized protein n=1 Tax=Dictyocaulus viviparus TaxID=29172 RepID=A0A0D8XKW1_DICVI|nr:hypothetical protein DICVIV_09563 [Dictyocaulus viviparus]